MRVFKHKTGTGCSVMPDYAENKQTGEKRYFIDPVVLSALIEGKGYDQAELRQDPKYGPSITLMHRKAKKPDKTQQEEEM